MRGEHTTLFLCSLGFIAWQFILVAFSHKSSPLVLGDFKHTQREEEEEEEEKEAVPAFWVGSPRAVAAAAVRETACDSSSFY